VASKSNRARRLERARAERRMARLAEQQRRRRRIQAIIGGSLAVIVLVLGTTWLLGGFDGKSETTVASPVCTWTPRDASLPGTEDTGLPSNLQATSGVKQMMIKTNLGDITAIIDVASAKCAAGSMEYLANRGFYTDTTCHQLDTTNTTLTCGSKSADGVSGPGYQFPTEGLPRDPIGTATDGTTPVYYVQGAVLMSNLDVNAVGSQFMIVYGANSPIPADYTQVATITTGLDLVQQVADAGAVDANGASAAVGKPAKDLVITSIAFSNDLSLDNPDATPTSTTT
jgi:peptidyl-prolyl cis-trans isomerase B (cyclophilin B)